LEALDPRYRTVLLETGIAGLFAFISLPAHAPDELTLEARRVVRLLTRTTRSVAPTEAGQRLL
jgi:hypothetical protein